MAMRTLAAIAADLEAGRTTSRKLAEANLEKAADKAGEGPRVFVALDPAKVRAQADAQDTLRKHGVVPSPLAGLTVSVKDLFDVSGETTRAGSKALNGSPPAKADAPIIARLRAAGAVLMGRTNMTEFAYSGVGMNPHYGTPASPYDRKKSPRIPGGSSAGAAVSVTDGMAAIALGTDTGGSCRIPAAMCGTVGYKPTQSRIPLAGAYPLSFSLDSIGSLGASVACVALIDQIMAGEVPSAVKPPPLAGRRLAVPSNVALEALDADVAKAFEAAINRLSRAGVKIETLKMPTLDRVAALFDKGGIAAAEAYALHKPLIARKAADFDPRVRTRIELGATQSAADYLGLLSARRELCAAFDAETADFDAVLMPTCPIAPPPIAAFEKDEEFLRLNRLLLRNTSLGNQLDRCSISLPCHAPGSAPVGLMLTGERGADRHLLRLAAGVEAALSGTAS